MEVFNPELRILVQKDEESTGLILATPVLYTAKGVDNAINTAKTSFLIENILIDVSYRSTSKRPTFRRGSDEVRNSRRRGSWA